jgi:hypothetical protein
LMKIVIPGAGLIRSGEISLKRVFSYFCEGPFGIERVSIEVCTNRETLLPYRI